MPSRKTTGTTFRANAALLHAIAMTPALALAACSAPQDPGASSLGVVSREAEPADISRPHAGEAPDVAAPDIVTAPTLAPTAASAEGEIEFPRQRIRYPLILELPREIVVEVEGRGDFDPTVAIMDEQGRRIAFDDDGGEGRDARLRRTLEAASYLVEVSGAGRSTGRFRLTLR